MGEKVEKFFLDLIDESIKLREEKNIVRHDMIQLLMEAKKGNLKQDKDNNDLTPQFSNIELAAQALIFLFAGFDSVATVMSFLAYELAVNSDVQTKLRKEINETFDNIQGDVSYEVLLKMKYMDMVINGKNHLLHIFQIINYVCRVFA